MTNITMLVANRPRLLKQALDSIGDLSQANLTIRDCWMNKEVSLIARAFGDENVVSLLARAFGDENVAYCPIKEPTGTGKARNQVIQISERTFGRGDYLYLSDDDVFFTRPDWLKVLIECYEQSQNYGVAAVGAYNHPFNCPNLPPIAGGVSEVYALSSQSMLMRWEVWDRFGPFCDTPAGKVCQSEDVDFSNRIRAAGFKVGVVSPALLVNCGITNSFGEKIPGWEAVKAQCPEGVLCE